MIDGTITLLGNVATEPKLDKTKSGLVYTHFRVAASSSRFDRRSRQWIDEDASFYTVYCWRAPLADNVKGSLELGQPIFVHGKVKVREWNDDKGERHWVAEIDARAIGHDLFKGVTEFTKNERPDEATDEAEAIDNARKDYMNHRPDVNPETGEIINADANGRPPAVPAESSDVKKPKQAPAKPALVG